MATVRVEDMGSESKRVTLDANVFKEFFRFFEEVAILIHLSMVSLPVYGLVSRIVGFLRCGFKKAHDFSHGMN